MNRTDHPNIDFSLFDEKSGILNLTVTVPRENHISLTVAGLPSDHTGEVRILVQNIKESTPFYLESETSGTDTFLVDLTPLKKMAVLGRQTTFCFFIECMLNNKQVFYALSEQDPPTSMPERYRIFAAEIWLQETSGTSPIEYVGIAANKKDFKNLFCAALCSRNRYLELTHTCLLRSCRMNGGILKLKFDLETGLHNYVKTVFSFRSKLSEDAVSYDFQTLSAKKHGDLLRVTVSLDLKTVELKSIYWDVRIILQGPVTENTGALPISMDVPARMYQKFLYNGSFSGEKGFFLYPYYTGKQTLAFAYREKNSYDGLNVIFREFLALFLYRIARPYWKKKHICLVCEKFSSMAQDNGYYFFKHCMDNQEEQFLGKNIYYIITKDSPDRERVLPYKNRLLDFMSLRHLCYILAADLIVSSDSRYHTYPLQSRHSIFNRYIKKIPFVFLQHGVIALKKVDNFYGKGQKGACDLFVVSTDTEKQTIVDNFGYEPKEVINTGLPRWDVLHDKSQDRREIMIMPTWRNWLDSVPDKDFEASDYFTHYMALLNSRKLADLLEKYDLEVNFYLHAKFQEYSDQFQTKSERIHLVSFGETAVNEMLMRCRMLITDYSSVCWDILYQDKPTIFYQFDLDKYEEAHGSYLDMRTELFGDRAENQEQLLALLEEQIKNNFKMKPEHEQLRRFYFNFKDQQHSRHICEEIKEKLL